MALIDNGGNQLGLIDLLGTYVNVSVVGMRCSELLLGSGRFKCDTSYFEHWAYSAYSIMTSDREAHWGGVW